MNYYKAAEDILRSVNTLKKAVENLKNRKNRLVSENKPSEPGSIDYSKPFTDTSFVNNTLNELLEVSECTRNISETERKIQEIEDILEQLSDEHKTILIMWYIERKSKESIMSKMYIESLTTVYNLKNKAVAEFALLYFGASAINSI